LKLLFSSGSVFFPKFSKISCSLLFSVFFAGGFSSGLPSSGRAFIGEGFPPDEAQAHPLQMPAL